MNHEVKKKIEFDNNKKTKKVYNKPKLKSEKILMYGALCNGTSSGGRKQTVIAGCGATKLLS